MSGDEHLRRRRRHVRLLGVEAEVVEVDVAPAARLLVDEAKVDHLSHVSLHVDGDAAHRLLLEAEGAIDDLVGVLVMDLEAGIRAHAAADQERRPRMRDQKRHAGERPLRPVAVLLVAADPVVTLMVALVAPASGDGVPLDRLVAEGVPLGGPVLQRAGLEVEIERLAVGADRGDAIVGRGPAVPAARKKAGDQRKAREVS